MWEGWYRTWYNNEQKRLGKKNVFLEENKVVVRKKNYSGTTVTTDSTPTFQLPNSGNSSALSSNAKWSAVPKPATAPNPKEDQIAQTQIISASHLGDLVLTSENNRTAKRKNSSSKESQPKRPMSAYNIFFKEERRRIILSIPDSEAKVLSKSSRKRKQRPHGKIGFESLAKTIGMRWQSLREEELAVFKKKAQEDMLRYKSSRVKRPSSFLIQ